MARIDNFWTYGGWCQQDQQKLDHQSILAALTHHRIVCATLWGQDGVEDTQEYPLLPEPSQPVHHSSVSSIMEVWKNSSMPKSAKWENKKARRGAIPKVIYPMENLKPYKNILAFPLKLPLN